MSFQYVIDNAESISMNRMKIVASTQSRDGTYRAVSRGGQVWQFEVKLPDGPLWTDWRDKISKLEALDRVTNGTIQFNNSGHDWLSKYQGNSVNYTGFQGSWIQGNNYLTLAVSPTTSSGYKFKAGDWIQLGSTGRVYTVAADVAYNATTVTLHRNILESTASNVVLNVGPNCQFTVICSQFPTWNIFARNQVSWSGPFIFTEVF